MAKSNSGTYHLYKMTKNTPCFKKGQKVWISTCSVDARAFGRRKGDLQWICAYIRPMAHLGKIADKQWRVATYRNHGKVNAKYIDTVELSGYLHDLFSVMFHNKRFPDRKYLTLDEIGYKATAQELLDNRAYLLAQQSYKHHKEKIKALNDLREAIKDEIREAYGIDLRDPCANMSIAEMRKLDWLKR